MKTQYVIGLAMLAGAVLGAASVNGLNAQGKSPGAYAIVAYSDVGEPAAFKANVLDKAPEAIKKHGGRFLVRTTDITVLRAGDPPLKRYVIIGFDNAEQAKAWYNGDDMKGVVAYNAQHTKGRAFIVPAAAQEGASQ